jgi:hypothetical protein
MDCAGVMDRWKFYFVDIVVHFLVVIQHIVASFCEGNV